MAKKKKLGRKYKGIINKICFPNIADRPKMKIDVTQNFTAMVMGHGKTRTYLHRFNILESTTCPCGKGDQTTDHLIYHSTLLQHQREVLKKEIPINRNWPVNKHDLITKYIIFRTFTNVIDFEKL
jgi:hypothetical protein